MGEALPAMLRKSLSLAPWLPSRYVLNRYQALGCCESLEADSLRRARTSRSHLDHHQYLPARAVEVPVTTVQSILRRMRMKRHEREQFLAEIERCQQALAHSARTSDCVCACVCLRALNDVSHNGTHHSLKFVVVEHWWLRCDSDHDHVWSNALFGSP